MELLELTRELVHYDTTPGQSNGVMIDFLAEYCESIGFSVSKYPYEGDKGKQQFNLVAVKGSNSTDSKPVLGLSGHTDTVPFIKESGNPESWSFEPLELKEVDNMYYGLGITDMKLFLAIALKASEAIDARHLRKPLALYFSAEEEVGCNGISHLLPANNPLVQVADYVIIGEPTEMKPGIAHKGYFFFQVEVSATVDESDPKARRQVLHSSDDRRATNVVEVVWPPISLSLTELRESLKGHLDPRFDPPYPTFNIAGKITYPVNAMKNIIPIKITVDCELRSLPFQNQEHITYLLRRYIRESIRGLKMVNTDEVCDAPVKFVRDEPTPAMETPEDSPIARYTLKASGSKSFKYFSYNTEGGIFNRAGAQSMIWGPGSIKQAHKKDEFVLKHWLSPNCVEKYIALIRHFCCEEAVR